MANQHLITEGRRTLSNNKRDKIFLLMETIEVEEGKIWDHLDVAALTGQRSVGHTVDAHTEQGGKRYVFEVSDPADAEKLKQISKLSSGRKVRVGSHPNLNRVRWVVSSADIITVRDKFLLV